MTFDRLFSIPQITLAAFTCGMLLGCDQTTGTGSVNGADPGVLEAPIAFVKRPIPVDEDGDDIQSDLRQPLFFSAGGDVYLRSNSTVSAVEANITAGVTLGTGDVKDLKPHFDGTKLLFTLRLRDENENDDVVPRWNIYEYDLTDQTLRPIISDDLTAERGDDVAPAYLPDGRIIFSSNRQRKSGEVLTNEGKTRFSALDEDERTQAMVLHVMTSQGGDIHQVSFNQSHDLDPTVLTNSYNGEVMFTRWDNAAGNNAMHLYKMKPDGTDVQVLYGVHSHDTGSNNAGTGDATVQFVQSEEMENGRILVLTKPFTRSFGGGNITIIDTQNFVNQNQPVFNMSGLPGPAQNSATINNISTEMTTSELSLGGRYSAAYPLWDGSNRLLVSKSSCTLNINDVSRPCIGNFINDPNAQEASPTYAIWLYDMNNNSEKVVVPAEQNTVITDIVALQSRPLPGIIFDKTDGELDIDWRGRGLGALHIRSVYDFGNASFDGCFLSECTDAIGISTVNDLGNPVNATADQRPARFVRFIKPVALPDEDDPTLVDPPDLDRDAFGRIRNQGMREIIGYAPVEPDGSVKVLLPANIPLAVSVLDKQGRRIGPRHQNWFVVQPGDTLQCTGCHTHATTAGATPNIHHRSDAEAPSINAGVPANGIFENTQIPGTPDPYFGSFGQSMAEVRFIRSSSSELLFSADLIYEDLWTDPSLPGRAPDTSFSYQYSMLDVSLQSPANTFCAASNFKCRILINYAQHIHPLWSLNRGVNTCTNCHTNVDPVLLIDKVPDAQLDLSGDASTVSDQNADHLKSYRELFFNDQGLRLDATGQLENIQIEVAVLDADGNPTFDIDGNPITEFIDDPTAVVRPSMSANGARASYFIEKLTETEVDAARSLVTTVDHSSFMSPHELRLVGEWLDIGAQNFNDPFDPLVPMN